MRMRYTHYTFILAAAAAMGIGAVALRRATGQAETPPVQVTTAGEKVPAEATTALATANDEPGPALAAPANPALSSAEQSGAPQAAAPAATPTSDGAPATAAAPGTPRGATNPNTFTPAAFPPGANPGAGRGFRERELRVIEGNGEAVYRFLEPIAQPAPGGWGGGESDPEVVQLHASDAQLGHAADALIQQYGQTEDEQARAKLKEQLNETLAKQFDVQQQLREHEIAKIEAKVKKLRDIITKRTDARQTIIERRLDQLLREADGLGWSSPANSAAQVNVLPRYPGGATPVPSRQTPHRGGNRFVPPSSSGQLFIPNAVRPPEPNSAPTAVPAPLVVPAPATSPPPSRPGAFAALASARQKAINNMKQIMLALHNYYDVNGHFPPPVLTGPDGKTPYSWRVAILPYLEQTELYKRYKFDEPWDSDNNKRVLEQMPAVLRDPSADRDSKDTSYFALVGAETCFGERGGTGTTFAKIKDGTANTIMLVEAKREVPWTKPEDIEYDDSRPRFGLGGFAATEFLAGFADGSVRALPKTIDEEVMRHLITRAGGERVDLESWRK